MRKNSAKTLTVHLVPHSHDDPGWLTTVDEYFVGYSRAGRVSVLISSAIEELLKDERRTFTYTEMKYFTMWYNV